MKPAKGPRPLAIWAFAALLVVPTLYGFASQLAAAAADPRFADSGYRISMVSGLSARLVIVAISVSAIVIFASRIAKWLVTVMSAISLIVIISPLFGLGAASKMPVGFYIEALIAHFSFLLLFTPSAGKWFAQRQEVDVRVFD